MKVTCINGSARSDGSCAHLINSFIDGASENNVETVVYCVGPPTCIFATAVKNAILTEIAFSTTTCKR